MIALVIIASLLAGPTPHKKCIVSCEHQEMLGNTFVRCWYDQLNQCPRFSQQCVEHETLVCTPRVVNLGTWEVSFTGDRPQPPAPTYHYSHW